MKHGHCVRQPDGRRQSITYTSWRAAMQRCYNKNHVKYPDYGGKGIKVHERWHRFADFLADMGERPSREHTLGRSTPFSDYAPRECTWQTIEEQNTAAGEVRRKKAREGIVTAYGLTMTMEEWAKALGVKFATFREYLRKGKDPYERAAANARRLLGGPAIPPDVDDRCGGDSGEHVGDHGGGAEQHDADEEARSSVSDTPGG